MLDALAIVATSYANSSSKACRLYYGGARAACRGPVTLTYSVCFMIQFRSDDCSNVLLAKVLY